MPEVSFQVCQQIDQIPATISMCRRGSLLEETHQQVQLLFSLLLASEVHQEPFEHRPDEHAYLALAQIVVALCFHQCVGHEQPRACMDDFLTHLFYQPFTDI